MQCDNDECESSRIVLVNGKVGDLCSVEINDNVSQGDGIPEDIGIGAGDYIRFKYCLNCGKIRGEFPFPQTKLEKWDSED